MIVKAELQADNKKQNTFSKNKVPLQLLLCFSTSNYGKIIEVEVELNFQGITGNQYNQYNPAWRATT